jgi:AraC-like DNA-binding protein
MTTAVSEAEPTGRIEFHTTHLDRAIDYLNKAYQTTLRPSGTRDNGHLFAHSRADGGSFALDDLRLPVELAIRQPPLGALVIIELAAGKLERECGGVSERFLAGDVFLDAQPTLPASVRMLNIVLQPVMLDLAVLAQVAATSSTLAPGPVRLTGYLPTSAAAAAHWKRTVSYLRELLGNGEAATQPLIRANAARLLAATVLTTFPNTAVTDPTAQDRNDATTATAQRAIAFIEQHAHADVSLADIAAAANVSIRTVQLAFRRHLDTTPMAYLRAARLDRAHHELLAADPSHGDTVTAIAHRWGFYNQSRFAARYRHTYGLKPHQTLRN